MASSVGELSIKLTFDKKALTKAINDVEKDVASGGDKMAKTWSAKMGIISGITSEVFGKITSAITGSIDSAIKRVDTLNNSSKVFEALGYSSDAVSSSMNTLKTYLDGLPTSMTDAVNGVQSLAASFGGIEQGTEYFIAMNDAGLAFGATSDMVANAITQLSQTSLDGPLDAETWNSLRNSGFTPVLAAMANEVGMTMGELKEDFGGKGTKTVQDFLNILVRLDKEGSGSMESLSKIARKNTDGIGTAIKNVQNRIAAAIKKVIDEIGSEKIANTIDNISSSFSGMADAVVNAIRWIGDNANWLIPLVGGLVAAFAAYEAISKAVAIAQGIMNAVMSVNPIGLLIAAVAGLVTGLILLWNNCEGFRNFIMGAISAIGEAMAALGDFIEVIFQAINAVVVTVFSAIWNFIQAVVNFIVQAFQNLRNVISTIFQAVWSVVSTIFGAIWIVVSTIIGKIVAIFQNLWKIISTILGYIGNFFKSIFNAVWNVVSWVFNNIRNAVQGAWNFIVGVFSGIGNFFRGVFTNAFNAVKNVFGGIIGFFQGIWNKVTDIFRTIGTTIGNAVSGTFKAVVNGVLGTVENILNAPIRAINGLIDVINAIPGIELGHLSEFNLPRMAHGGIVPGTSYSGDHNMIMANSGEMVITRSQQAALWSMIERGNYDEGEESGVSSDRSIEINNNYEINNNLDAEVVGDIISAQIRKAVI